ncbi:carboxypeptidase-like regulatory domain-containing protein [Flavobacterium sp. H122]|uniref:carboxypeptidase-like regulatory domain-containing protein n=1 Tax=Flavobacterium sp. H122 TaxID=2529860 RepID=UPI0010AB0711|nr:carboxypeptidase-like regulatory domain-containing protein [Flavobacterium sp. H122]
MKRRLFVKKTGIVSMGILAFSGAKVFANTTEEKSSVIDLLPFSEVSQKIILKGSIVDAITSQPIGDCKMTVKAKTNRLFNTTKNILTSNGDYTIVSGFIPEGKISRKIEVEIEADGYKTYTSFIYLSVGGCHLHSKEWDYNKNFDHNNCPKNKRIGSEIVSLFNFRLVK